MTKHTTIYLDPKLHQAIKLEAVRVRMSVSDLVNNAVQLSLKGDSIDLDVIHKRAGEPARSFEDVLKDLKKSDLL